MVVISIITEGDPFRQENGDDAKLEILRNTNESTDQVPCRATSKTGATCGCVILKIYTATNIRLGHCVIVIQIWSRIERRNGGVNKA